MYKIDSYLRESLRKPWGHLSSFTVPCFMDDKEVEMVELTLVFINRNATSRDTAEKRKNLRFRLCSSSFSSSCRS